MSLENEQADVKAYSLRVSLMGLYCTDRMLSPSLGLYFVLRYSVRTWYTIICMDLVLLYCTEI